MKTSKKQLIEKCRHILYSNEDLSPLNNTDFKFMLGILKSHPEKDTKIGSGVVSMWTGTNPIYGNRNFWILRKDGSTTDFSFMKCLSKQNLFKSACRNAIRPQILKFRIKNRIATMKEYHVDHHPESFDSLLTRFVEKHGECKVKIHRDNTFGSVLDDEEYCKKWQDFHQKHAKLRVLSAKENLTKKRL